MGCLVNPHRLFYRDPMFESLSNKLQNVFKNLRDMLDNYNRSIDDLLGLIR